MIHRPSFSGRRRSRRSLLATALLGGGIAAGAVQTLPARTRAFQLTPPPSSPNTAALAWRGVVYDLGIAWAPGYTSRPELNLDFLARDLAAIHDDLHANTVSFASSDRDRLITAAGLAHAAGLNVWLQPRLIDGTPAAKLAQLAALAPAAEALRADLPGLVLNLGAEETVFLNGLVPGASYAARTAALARNRAQRQAANVTLNAFLTDAVATVRASFTGPLSYSAGVWETVDWDLFDIIGQNLYRDAVNAARYQIMLELVSAASQPVVITEFGAAAFIGAPDLGGKSFTIVDRTVRPARLTGDYERSEATQAAALIDQLDTFVDAGVTGAFVYTFLDLGYPTSTDPRYDLDMASFSLVTTFRPATGHGYATTGEWQSKQAFHAVAARYQELATAEAASGR